MNEPAPSRVTLHVWRVPARRVPAALGRVATDRFRLRGTPGLHFSKSLGTGSGRSFDPRDADPTRWALLTTWASDAAAEDFEDHPVVRRWDAVAVERCRIDLLPLASRGRWSRRAPFGNPSPGRYAGAVAALTRARLRPTRMAAFYRAVPPVVRDLHASPGLRVAFGVGEAPVGLQGTFSVWDSVEALTRFANRGAAHTDVVRRTAETGWYAEELFARFAVVAVAGTVGGRWVG